MKRTRDYRRSVAETHVAKRKWICKHIYNWMWYDNDNQYSKNKVYCSCWMCRGYHQYLGELKLKSLQEEFNEECKEFKVRIPNRYTEWHSCRHSHGWK